MHACMLKFEKRPLNFHNLIANGYTSQINNNEFQLKADQLYIRLA